MATEITQNSQTNQVVDSWGDEIREQIITDHFGHKIPEGWGTSLQGDRKTEGENNQPASENQRYS